MPSLTPFHHELLNLDDYERHQRLLGGSLLNVQAAARYAGLDVPICMTPECYTRLRFELGPKSRSGAVLTTLPDDLAGHILVLLARVDVSNCEHQVAAAIGLRGRDGVLTIAMLAETEVED